MIPPLSGTLQLFGRCETGRARGCPPEPRLVRGTQQRARPHAQDAELAAAGGGKPGVVVSEAERARWRGIMEDLQLSGPQRSHDRGAHVLRPKLMPTSG